jgi:hypothetical protein
MRKGSGLPESTIVPVNGDQDVIPSLEGLRQFVPNVEEVSLPAVIGYSRSFPKKPTGCY